MRKLSIVFAFTMLLFLGSVFANELSIVNPSKNLSIQISKLLKNNTLTQNEVEFTAQVRFTLNKEHQILVLSVETENPIIAEFVQAKLNYKNVDLNDYREGRIYNFPVRIVR